MPDYVIDRRLTKPEISEALRSGVEPQHRASTSDTRVIFGNGGPWTDIRKLSTLYDLKDNWDQYGAISPSNKAFEKAKELLYILHGFEQPVYDLGPGPNGDVSIEIHKGLKSVEFILYDDRAFFVRFSRPDYTEQGVFHLTDTYSHIEWLRV